MFSLFYGLWNYMFSKTEFHVLILGVDKAGKTVILFLLTWIFLRMVHVLLFISKDVFERSSDSFPLYSVETCGHLMVLYGCFMLESIFFEFCCLYADSSWVHKTVPSFCFHLGWFHKTGSISEWALWKEKYNSLGFFSLWSYNRCQLET